MTLGELLAKMENDIFSKSSEDSFEKKCYERETGLKTYMKLCQTIIIQHIEIPKHNERKLKYWKKEKIKSNIENLSNYILELAEELDKEKIENYCKKLIIHQLPFNPNLVYIIRNSYYGSIVTDILWAENITIREALEISAGVIDINKLGLKLPKLLAEVKTEIIPYLSKNEKYYSHKLTIDEAVICYEKKLFKACNLLLLTVIEGIVRDLAEFLNEKQLLFNDLEDEKFNSLDSLLRCGNWKNDIVINSTKLMLINEQEKKGSDKIEADEKVNINLKTRLDFLRRRFKEDRDLILHGVQKEYSSNWNLFLNFAALSEVYNVVKYYDGLYVVSVLNVLFYLFKCHNKMIKFISLFKCYHKYRR